MDCMIRIVGEAEAAAGYHPSTAGLYTPEGFRPTLRYANFVPEALPSVATRNVQTIAWGVSVEFRKAKAEKWR